MNTAFIAPHNYIPSAHKNADACLDASCLAKQHRKELSPAEFRCDSQRHYVENSLQDREGRLLSTWMVKWQNPLTQLRRESLSEIQQAHNAIIRAVSSSFRIYVNPLDVAFHLLNPEETRITLASASTGFSGKTITLLDADAGFLPPGYEKTVHGAMLYLSQDVLKKPGEFDQAIAPIPIRPMRFDSDTDRVFRADSPQKERESRDLDRALPQIHSESQTDPIAPNPNSSEAAPHPQASAETPAVATSELHPPLPVRDPYNAITRKYIDFIENGSGNWSEKAQEFRIDLLRNENGSGYLSFESMLKRDLPRFTEALEQLAEGEHSDELDRLEAFLVSMYQRSLQFWMENIKKIHRETFSILRNRFKDESIENIKKIYYKIHAASNILIAIEAAKHLTASQRKNLIYQFIGNSGS